MLVKTYFKIICEEDHPLNLDDSYELLVNHQVIVAGSVNDDESHLLTVYPERCKVAGVTLGDASFLYFAAYAEFERRDMFSDFELELSI